ncbi:hypothetical protein Esti_000209 [Eimeria stiedai]
MGPCVSSRPKPLLPSVPRLLLFFRFPLLHLLLLLQQCSPPGAGGTQLLRILLLLLLLQVIALFRPRSVSPSLKAFFFEGKLQQRQQQLARAVPAAAAAAASGAEGASVAAAAVAAAAAASLRRLLAGSLPALKSTAATQKQQHGQQQEPQLPSSSNSSSSSNKSSNNAALRRGAPRNVGDAPPSSWSPTGGHGPPSTVARAAVVAAVAADVAAADVVAIGSGVARDRRRSPEGPMAPPPLGPLPMGYGVPPAMVQPQRPVGPPQQQQQQQQQQRSTTLYIGNITKHADNDFMRNLLGEFGRVLRWNRQSDPVSGQLAAFGFCEFTDPAGAAKCITCLTGLKLQGRALVVNCNDKVRGEIAKVNEERILSTMRAFKSKSREEVEAEIAQEDQQLKTAVQKLLDTKNATLPDEVDAEPTDPKVAPPPQPPEPHHSSGGKAGAAANTSSGSAFHRLRKLDPEAIAAAAENSIYRIAPDGTDRRTYVDEEYRPSRRELERLQSAGRREAEYEREFTRREAAWKTVEQNLALDREKELVGEMEISSADKTRLIELDLRGEWWDGLGDPSVRAERKRQRISEAEEDERDAAAELQEQAAKEGGGVKAAGSRQQQQQEEDDEKDRETDEYRRDKPSHNSSSSSSSSSRKERETERAKSKSGDKVKTPRHGVAVYILSVCSCLSPVVSQEFSKSSSSNSSSKKSSKELRRYFEDEEEAVDAGRKHRPLTKLEDHRDVVNKVNKVKETMKVIEDSKKILAMVPSEKAELFAYKVDWSLLVQKGILEKKLRPWVRKKVIEFMGAEEDLVQEVIDYILKRVEDRPNPKELLEELSRFLDEEAEGFLKHMWRLLIFEQLKNQKQDKSHSQR